ncbi:MAG: phosphoribosylanthranilate isomerase [Actinobacteria bacterium]|nr:phosphoribosylanthranilate isomerase [Actinomycetota bacterium]
MKTQIYGITTVEDAVAVARLGADRMGLVVCEDESLTPDGISVAEAREIMAALPETVIVNALIFSNQVDELEETVRAVGAKAVHLSALPGIPEMPVAEAEALLKRVPGLEIMMAIPVGGPEAVEHAKSYEGVAATILLDTVESSGQVGATGKTHDWEVSRRIVEEVDIPVVLAGGLSPANVAEAIRAVRPWGVDSFTQTSHPDNLKRKDLNRVRDFIEAAQGALSDG